MSRSLLPFRGGDIGAVVISTKILSHSEALEPGDRLVGQNLSLRLSQDGAKSSADALLVERHGAAGGGTARPPQQQQQRQPDHDQDHH